MRSLPIKTALKHVSAWSIIAGFVALLTLIFSFLGTLFCSALGGMMMGATKASRALSIVFSLLCPGVLLATMRSQKTELPQRQVLVLAFLCVAVFWALYLISRFLIAYEKKEYPEELAKRPLPGGVAESPATAALVQDLCPADLEGKWCYEAPGPNGHAHKRILEIKEGSLALSTLDAEGHSCLCARGLLKLQNANELTSRSLEPEAELASGI
jgi:hypothetical protein